MSTSSHTVPSALTRGFWDACGEHRLVRPVCRTCGHNFFVPQLVCPRCHSEDWAYVESSGRGSVSAFTVVHRAPVAGLRCPYVVAVIDLDEGWFMMSNVVGCAPEDVRIGLRVGVEFETRDDGVLPIFRPEAVSNS